jgi:hypothetical protein
MTYVEQKKQNGESIVSVANRRLSPKTGPESKKTPISRLAFPEGNRESGKGKPS